MYFGKEHKLAEEKRILDRWDWLTEGVEDQDTKLNTSILLENAYDEMLSKEQVNEGFLEAMLNEEESLTEAPVYSAATGTNLIPRVLFPMIRRVFPSLIANQIVSVQPLTAPTGVIYYIQYTFTNTKGGITAADEYSAYAHVDSPAYATWYTSEKIGPFTGTISSSGDSTVISTGTQVSGFFGDSVDPSLKRIELYNAANGTAYTTVLRATGTAATAGFQGTENVYYRRSAGTIQLRKAGDTTGTNQNITAAPWAAGASVVAYLVYDQEGSSNLPEMEFSIQSDTVSTTERKLKVRWTKEAEQDMKAYHKIDVESELVKMASMEMNYEIDREIITFISDRVITALSFLHDWTADAPNTGNNTAGNFLDRHRSLSQKIHQVGAKIAQYNRQGAATWAVCSPSVAAVLQMLPDFKGTDGGRNFNIYEAGKLGGNMSVFVDPNRVGGSAGEILLGYKSLTTTYGSGAVYAPYVNWMSNVVTHPDNFNSIRGFFSRYALHMVVRGAYYYGKINISNLTI